MHHTESVRVVSLSILVSAVTAAITVGVMRVGTPEVIVSERPSVSEEVQSEAIGASSYDTVPDVVEQALPGVVSVVIAADVPIIERYFEEYSPFGDFFGGGFGFHIPRERQIGTERRTLGGGTGFFVSDDGYIITNRHVVDQDGVEFSVVTHTGESYPVDIVAKDGVLDIAILKVSGTHPEFPVLTFGDSDTLRLGEEVIAIGNALAEFPNSVSVGVVSGLARNIVAQDAYGMREALDGVIQTDAAINPGNSGGPLLNRVGQVIGVNVAVANGSENIGFSLPGNLVRDVLRSVQEHGEIIRPFLGIRYMQITQEIAKENNLPEDYGILVIRGERRGELAVIPGSPADKAGIEENDIIRSINGIPLDGSRSFAQLLRGYAVGEEIVLSVLHDGDERDVRVKLEKAPGD